MQTSNPQPSPFRVEIKQEVLDDLRARLARTRWPDEPSSITPWETGTSVDYMERLAEYWQSGFDWRAWEARINALHQFKVPVRGIDLHFIHEPGRGPAPLPLLLSHGWPGSVIEFLRVIPMLTDPARFGGDPRDAFTVVAPSLPGYGLSWQPGQAALGVEEIADVFADLMTVLGHDRFGAQGGDWGAFITSRLGHAHAQRVLGIHLNMLAVRRDADMLQTEDVAERRFAAELAQFLKEETGYQWIQGTRPITLAYGLTDSPAGLAAWLVEKFQRWSDNNGDPASAVGRDEMLANITLYWATGAIGSSFWPYYYRMHRAWPIPKGKTVNVPLGYLEFPREILRPPRSVAQRAYSDIRRWTVSTRGGHFAALEQPELLVHELREFFRPLRVSRHGTRSCE